MGQLVEEQEKKANVDDTKISNKVSNNKKTNKNNKEDDVTSYMYIGPSFPSGILPTGRMYIGGIPKEIKEMFEPCPSLEKLFIPIDKNIGKAEENINNRGTIEHKYAVDVKSYFSNGQDKIN